MKMGSNLEISSSAKTFFMLVAAWTVTAPLVVSQSTNLLQVQMLFRHGARAPIGSYPTDPNPPEVWPEGLEGLTQLGKRQHYTLGTFLRYFYYGFVTSNPNEVLVNSTDYERCLQSALSNLAAFYEPTEPWVVEEGLHWQPVVVHYLDRVTDKYLSTDVYCPKLTKEQEQQYNSSDYLSEFEKHQDLFKALKEYGGLNTTGWLDVFEFQDTVFTEKYHGLTVPEWIEPYWDQLTALSELTFRMMYNTTVLKRLGPGPILGKFLENMDNKIAGKEDPLKVHMYSAHDANIAGVLEALDLFEHRPPFAACLLVELHETQGGQAVRLLYLNSTTMHEIYTIRPNLLKLQGCGEFCPLEHFRQLVQPFIPEDWNKECQTTD